MAEKIEYTHRAVTGMRARILCRNRKHKTHPVVVLVESSNGQEETFVYLTESLHRVVPGPGDLSEPYIREMSVWEDLPIDTLVWVRNGWGDVYPAYFAGHHRGCVYVWSGGKTSLTAEGGGRRTPGNSMAHADSQVFLQKPE